MLDRLGNPSMGMVGQADGLTAVGVGGASMHGSAQSTSSKMPPQVPISAHRRKILAA